MKSKRAERPRVVIVNRCIVLNEKSEILLIRRASSDAWSADMWEVPGGKLDEGQDISHALEREVMEETGLLITPKSRLSYIDSWVLAAGPYKGLPYILIYGIGTANSTEATISDEHSDFKWVLYKEAINMELTSETKKALLVLKDQIV